MYQSRGGDSECGGESVLGVVTAWGMSASVFVYLVEGWIGEEAAGKRRRIG